MTDSAASIGVDYAAVFSVLDPSWASDTLPDDGAGRGVDLPHIVDEEGEDIFERECMLREQRWLTAAGGARFYGRTHTHTHAHPTKLALSIAGPTEQERERRDHEWRDPGSELLLGIPSSLLHDKLTNAELLLPPAAPAAVLPAPPGDSVVATPAAGAPPAAGAAASPA